MLPKHVSYANHPRFRPVFVYDDNTTVVVLLDKEANYEPVSLGMTVRSKRDRDNKRLAREICFGRAVKHLPSDFDYNHVNPKITKVVNKVRDKIIERNNNQ